MRTSFSICRRYGVLGGLLASVFLFYSGQALALTAANVDITNEATVTYEDNLGNSFTSTSNEAVVTVAEVYAATLSQDKTTSGAPGSTVYFQHTLTNTGNASDLYTITTFEDDGTPNPAVPDGISDTAGDDSDYFVYLDTNGNGQPEAGEPVILDPANASATLTVGPGVSNAAKLLVAFTIPGGAADLAEFGLTIQVTSANTTVDDVTGTNGIDLLEGTNNDIVTVTTGPNLVPVKLGVYEPNTADNGDDDTILYTLTITNNGGSAAEFVDILDAIPPNTTFNSIVSVSGLLAGGADKQMTGVTTGDPDLSDIGTGTASAFAIDETGVGLDTDGITPENIDINVDGDDTDTGVLAIMFRDASLPKDTTIQIQYRVDVANGLAGDTVIPNTFTADTTPSTQVDVTVPRIYDVDAADTGDAGGPNVASPAVNDGADDDDTADDIQTVDIVADGATVLFTNVITNNGNFQDTFELSIADTSGAVGCVAGFPAGTTFSFYNAANTASLANTNATAGDDTGQLNAGASLTITVRADLPNGEAASVGPFCATLTAESAAGGVTDTKTEKLDDIAAPALDLANADYDTGAEVLPQAVSGVVTSPADAAAGTVGFNDAGVADAHPDSGVATYAAVNVGDLQDFDVFIANEGVAADSYNLTTVGIPADWTVTYIQVGVDSDGDGTVDDVTGAGNTVTTTPLIPPGAVYVYIARVQTSATQALSLAVAPAGSDANSDGDLDYEISVVATSTTDVGVSDTVVQAIDINDNAEVAVTPDLIDQVQPGGSVGYGNTIENTGNLQLLVELTVSHSDTNFGDTTLIDTDGDGVGDTEIGNLIAGTITVDDGAGNDQDIEVTIVTAGIPILQLEPGEVIPLAVTVQAPATASQGDEDFFVITATDTSGTGVTDTTNDKTEVITVQVGLAKTVVVDAACGCDPTGIATGAGLGDFAVIPGAGQTQANDDVEPGECVIWKLTATNQSAQDALNVVINDSVTAFSTLATPVNGAPPAGWSADGLYYCAGVGCSIDSSASGDERTAIADADNALLVGNDISFDVGTLIPGEAATATFCVVVD